MAKWDFPLTPREAHKEFFGNGYRNGFRDACVLLISMGAALGLVIWIIK